MSCEDFDEIAWPLPENKICSIFREIEEELKHADAKHGPMMGVIEGLHTLKCEVAELEREIMREKRSWPLMRREAVQVASMAIKFLRDTQ